MRKVIFIALSLLSVVGYGQGIKISALPQAGSLSGSELTAVVQNGVTKKTSLQSIAYLSSGGIDSFWALSFGNIHNTNPNNVGIGLDSASFKLDVNGEVNVSNQYRINKGWGLQGDGTSYTELYGANGSDGIVLYDSGFYVGSWGNRSLIEGVASDGSMRYSDFSGDEILTLINNKCGIGNSSPIYPFQVGSYVGVNGSELRIGDLSGNTNFIAGDDGGAYLRLATGQEGIGKVWTSDANGYGSWQTSSSSGWGLNGNAGTDPSTNFIGTTDTQALVLKANNGGYTVAVFTNSSFNVADSANDVDKFIVDVENNQSEFKTSLRIKDGTEGTGKVFTSDSAGYGSWQYDTVGSGLYLPLAGGTMDSGSHIYFGTGGQNISQGTFDNSTGGNKGISLNCAVGYELNWQGGHLSSSYNNGTTFYPVIVDTALLINGTVKIIDGTQGAGKVLTSDSQGLASWVTPEYRNIIYDSLTALIGETVSLANNTTTIIASSGTVTSVTWSFPTGSTGDVLDVENMQTITTLNITGTGTGTITASKITNTKTAGLKTFHNYGGNWY